MGKLSAQSTNAIWASTQYKAKESHLLTFTTTLLIQPAQPCVDEIDKKNLISICPSNSLQTR